MSKSCREFIYPSGIKVDQEDADLAMMFCQDKTCDEDFGLGNFRGRLGLFLEHQGFGREFYTFSNAESQEQYINAILDYLEVE